MDSTGTVPVTWCEKDYQGLDWFKHSDFKYRFKSNVKNLDAFNVGVASCSQDLPETLTQVADNFGHLVNAVVAINKMTPGQVLPFHADNYIQYRKNFNLARDQDIARIIVFLHDPAPGHQLWVNDKFCHGHRGSYFSWCNNTSHMAANLGNVDRYVMQITGTIS
jgi:hypothetical protein